MPRSSPTVAMAASARPSSSVRSRNWRATGVEVVEVKTLDASAEYEPYVATRAFWEARGFVQVDCIDPLPDWQPGNPAAIYVAALTSERA